MKRQAKDKRTSKDIKYNSPIRDQHTMRQILINSKNTISIEEESKERDRNAEREEELLYKETNLPICLSNPLQTAQTSQVPSERWSGNSQLPPV